MNLFEAMQARRRSRIDSDHLPALNSFIDVATGGRTEYLPVEGINRTSITVRRPAKAAVGTKALFNYSNGKGRFRFYAPCSELEPKMATFLLPSQITVIEQFGENRRNYRLTILLPVQWRYANDGVGRGDFTAGNLANLSCSGAALIVRRQLEAGTQVELEMALGSGEPFLLLGRLSRETQEQLSGNFLAGIAFESLSPTRTNAISEFITSRQRSHRARALAD